MKRSPLQRRVPLSPGKPIGRKVPMPRQALEAHPVVPVQRKPAPARVRGKSTPPPVPAALRKMVLERAGWSCDRCARSIVGQPYSAQHRRARGAGGRRDGAHTPANLIILCGSANTPGSCHNFAENTGEGRAEAYDLGFAIRGEVRRPEDVPIFRHLRSWVIPGDGVWIAAEPLAS